MSERHELILRTGALTPEQAARIRAALEPLARNLPAASLSLIRRQHSGGDVQHLGRERVA